MTDARLITVAALFVFSAACSAPPAPAPPPGPPPMTPIERGQYLVTTGLCNDCHTPMKMGPNGPEPDMERQLSGHPEAVKVTAAPAIPRGWLAMTSDTFTAWAGPWGLSFTANITSDENTGIGTWTEDVFIKAMREGKHMGTGRPILPPMPWPYIGKYTDDDLKAIFAYLKSTRPISNHVPDPIPPK